LAVVLIAPLALAGLAVGLDVAEGETFTGTAARTGSYKRPLWLVDGKRQELKAAAKAGVS
jgi:hypothetical protein